MECLPETSEQAVVRFVGADPEPMEIVTIAVRHGPIRPAYVSGPDLTLLLQCQRGMKRIPFKQPELVVSQRLHVFRE